MKRKKSIARSSRPLRRSRPKQKRATPRRQANRCPELLAWISEQPCWVTGKSSGAQWENFGTWGMGGYFRVHVAHLPRTKRLGGDLWNVIPLFETEHRTQHLKGIQSWLAGIGKTMAELRAAAVEYTERFARETGFVLPERAP